MTPSAGALALSGGNVRCRADLGRHADPLTRRHEEMGSQAVWSRMAMFQVPTRPAGHVHVEFKAGRMDWDGRMVTPDKRKGKILLYTSEEDQLTHFQWMDRDKNEAWAVLKSDSGRVETEMMRPCEAWLECYG
eukprot:Skav200061  [mRNA]  locus=scaffold838:56535:58863:+ [translate_table: standard]